MSRKDTILIAVIINAGLLAVLLATAIIYDPDKDLGQTDDNPTLVEAKIEPKKSREIAVATIQTVDEVDNVLNSYSYRTNEITQDVFINEPLVSSSAFEEEDSQESATSSPSIGEDPYVTVTVKKGDVLEKIAKANGTTINAIKQANQLQHERLKIGQVLKIPVKKEQVSATASTSTNPPVKKKEPELVEAQYYVIKNGDNPWKIAKQFNVNFEDILRLNHLDEERARNLKAGDRIRIK